MKANWDRRAKIIDYCVQVLDDRPSDHRTERGDARSHPPLSVGVTDETKVRYDGDFLISFYRGCVALKL